MRDYLEKLPRPTGLSIQTFDPGEPFLDFAARFADDPDTVLLASGGDLDCARYHLLAVFPWLTMTARKGEVTLRSAIGKAAFAASPFQAVKEIRGQYTCLKSGDSIPVLTKLLGSRETTLQTGILSPDFPELPVTAGLFGYFAYDVKDYLEDLPRTVIDDLALPDCRLMAPRLLVIYDRITGRTVTCVPEFPDIPPSEIHRLLAERLNRPAPEPAKAVADGRFTSNFTRPEYMTAVGAIIDYIIAGDVYQVNLSQRFETGFTGHPYDLFRRLFEKNPAPFFAFINAGDHHIVSTSPERFIRQTGNRVETRPIKGTRPRGKTAAEDERYRRELGQSLKDQAELSMIVDLLRNDLGKVCRGGTVRVTAHKNLEAYDNVFHLVSIVEGEPAAKRDAADILAAAFPGGSITGCPKIRAMEIIDELEPCRRHIYTGAIGYIGFDDTMDMSIAIRTATILNGRLIYSAGGGIVYDSDPADEFEETLAKAATLLTTLTTDAGTVEAGRLVWINGRLRPAAEAAVPVDSPGFQYGAGLFETIRVDQGEPRFLERHLERFRSSWQVLFDTPVPELDWRTIINQVIEKNRLKQQTAVVKIMAAHGARSQAPWDHTLIVTARPYTHRLTVLGKPGLDLAVYPQPRRIATAAHKTLNYLFYHTAGQWAVRQGGDEAVILNPDKSVSETNTANILLLDRDTVTVPISDTVLPGIMQQAVLELLGRQGWRIREKPLTLDDCLKAEAILLTNSLMGAVPVLSIAGQKTGSAATAICAAINHGLAATGN